MKHQVIDLTSGLVDRYDRVVGEEDRYISLPHFHSESSIYLRNTHEPPMPNSYIADFSMMPTHHIYDWLDDNKISVTIITSRYTCTLKFPTVETALQFKLALL